MKILILSREFAHPNNACGVCLYNIADEFLKSGNEIYVISLVRTVGRFKYDGRCHVIEVQEDVFSTICSNAKQKRGILYYLFFKVVQFLRYFFVLFVYPNTAPCKTHEIFRIAKKIVSHEKIDSIIGSYTPYETIKAAVFLKIKFPSLKVVNYHLDPLLVPGNANKYVVNIKRKKANRSVEKELKYVDKILVPETFVQNYPSISKIQPVGFPLYKPFESEIINIFDKETLNIVYVGTIDADNRNIDYTITLIESLRNKSIKVCLHIWGTLLDKQSQNSINNSNAVVYHGIVECSKIPSILASADVLLNICNKTHYTSLPSKIFQLFASGKPILVVKRNSVDMSLPYFEKYSNICMVNEGDCSEETLTQVSRCLENRHDVAVSSQLKMFDKYTPKYICDLINF